MTILNPSLVPSDIDQLYSFCNDRYFNGELPQEINLEWSPKMFKKLGIAISRSNILDDNHTIRLSETIRGNKLKSLNIMVHEMLHIKAFDLYEKTGKRFYLDLDSKASKKNKDVNKNHGPTFHKWKDKLNAEYSELNISTKDDENYDDFEVNDKKYYGIYLQFTTVDQQIHHAVFYSDKDFRENEGSDLIDGLKALYGEENILASKTFSTGSHNIKGAGQLTSKGILRKKTAKSSYIPKFINDIALHESTEFNPEMIISRSTEFEHVNINLRKIANYNDKNKYLPFSKYSHSIGKTYGKEFGNSKLGNMSIGEMASNSTNGLTLDEIDYLYKRWTTMSDDDFIASEKNSISSLHFSIKRNYPIETIVKDLNYSFSDKGLFRFDSQEFMSKIKKACEKISGKGLDVDLSLLNNIQLSFTPKSIEECHVILSSKIDLDFNKFFEESMILLRDNGHLGESESYFNDIKSIYDNVSVKDISGTMAQYRFNLLLSDHSCLEVEKQKLELQTLISRFENRIEPDDVLATFLSECKKEMKQEGKYTEIAMQRIATMKSDIKRDFDMSL
jgi:hypothetical protein